MMHYGRRNPNFNYYIEGHSLDASRSMRDLGIQVSNDMKFAEHTREVVFRATRRINYIIRSVALTQPSIYYKLFDTYVLPIIMYGAPVWQPSAKKDIKLLQSTYKRFIRLVAYKCNVDKSQVRQLDLITVMSECDVTTFRKIVDNPAFIHEIKRC